MKPHMKELMDRILADKAASRIVVRAKAWPEKVAIIERRRDATALARKSMRAVKITPR